MSCRWPDGKEGEKRELGRRLRRENSRKRNSGSYWFLYTEKRGGAERTGNVLYGENERLFWLGG